MLEIDVESGQVVDAEAMDLGNVVFVAGDGAGWWSAGKRDILYESIPFVNAFVSSAPGDRSNHCSRKFSNSSTTFSPTLSTTFGTARAIKSRGRFLSVPRAPTTSSSGNPSTSLRAPADSDGGIEERWALRFRLLVIFVTPLRPPRPAARSRSALSLLINPSTIEDIVVVVGYTLEWKFWWCCQTWRGRSQSKSVGPRRDASRARARVLNWYSMYAGTRNTRSLYFTFQPPLEWHYDPYYWF